MNVIVVMLDSLRPDHLGCYGNPWIETPRIDEFSEEAITFERAYAEGMPTLPVRTALFTGSYTLMDRGWMHLKPEDALLAEVLWDSGYTTALITDTYHLHKPRMAYERGFDYAFFIRGQEADPYVVDPNVKVDLSKWHPKNYLTDHDKAVLIQYLKNIQHWRGEEDHFVAQVVEAGINWLESQIRRGRRDNLFLWLDSFDPHEPWDPPERYYDQYAPREYNDLPIIHPFIGGDEGGLVKHFTELEVKHIRAQYAGEVTMVDRWVGTFFDKVKELGLWDDTLIIVLSDHGEPLGEHGIIRKVRPWPYEELSRIVLIIKPPRNMWEGRGIRVKTFVQTPDIMPTILDSLKVCESSRSRWSVSPRIQGLSLLPLILGEEEKVRDYAIAGHYKRSWSIRDEDYSLYLWPTPRAYYTFGTRLIEEQEKVNPELYRLRREYVPPKPDDWSLGEQPEKINILDEERDVAEDLELKLLRELTKIRG